MECLSSNSLEKETLTIILWEPGTRISCLDQRLVKAPIQHAGKCKINIVALPEKGSFGNKIMNVNCIQSSKMVSQSFTTHCSTNTLK